MNASTQSNPSPILAPPGAGLPALELLFARLLFAYRFRTTTPEQASRKLIEERDRILSLVADCSESQLKKPVLIKRLPGIEDSSRYWSPLMAIEHLQIVNNGIMACIRELNAGRIPDRKADTATVKPSPDVDRSIVETFSLGCATLAASAEKIDFQKATLTHEHPWFGPLKALQWFVLSANHMALHRRQIERILTSKTQAA